MARVLTTETVHARERLEYWNEAVSDAYVRLTCDAPGRDGQAECLVGPRAVPLLDRQDRGEAEADVRVMKRISQYGGGLFHQTIDPTSLPQIVLAQLQDSPLEDPKGKPVESMSLRPLVAHLRGLLDRREQKAAGQLLLDTHVR